MNSLLQRGVTALVAILLLLVVLFVLPTFWALWAILASLLLAAWEWSGFLRFESVAPRLGYVAVVLVALVLSGHLLLYNPDALLRAIQVSLAWWAIAFVWILRYPTPIPRPLGAMCGLLVLIPAWLGGAHLITLSPRGPELLLLCLVIVWAADIGAYFVGGRFGKVKLAPRVSPGKTWEGFVGGLAGAAIAATVAAPYFGFPLSLFVVMALSVAALSVVGDLTVSMFKRNAALKDSGTLFPGHGGILDRIDSVTAAIPLFVLELSWFGLVSY